MSAATALTRATLLSLVLYRQAMSKALKLLSFMTSKLILGENFPRLNKVGKIMTLSLLEIKFSCLEISTGKQWNF